MAAPTSANISITINEDTPKVFTVSDFPFTPGDASDVFLALKITTLETKGALKLNDVDVTLNQVISRAEIEAGIFTFTPALNAFASPYDTFKFMVGDGTEYSIAYTATINVLSVTDVPPVSASTTITMSDNSVKIFSLSDFPFSDTDGGTQLEGVQIITVPPTGTLAFNNAAVQAGRLLTRTELLTNGLTFTPVANSSGTPYTSFTFKISDGQFLSTSAYTITINVAATNDAPTGYSYSITSTKNTTYSGTLPTAIDPENDSIVYSLHTLPLRGTCSISTDGTFSYTPATNFIGDDSFEYAVTDVWGAYNIYKVSVVVISVVTIPLTDVTTGATSVTGTGAFDEFMKAIVAHLTVEYDKRRITSETYPQVYLGAMQTALAQAVTFALQRPLIEKQATSEEAKTGLIIRQTKGFDDDAKQKLLKQALDSWSVAYSVAQDANGIPDAIKVNPIDSIMKNAMDSLGVVTSSNPLGEI